MCVLKCISVFFTEQTLKMQRKDSEEHQVKFTESIRRKKNRRNQIKSQETRLDSMLVPYPSCKNSLVFPCRPGYGQLGTKCLIKANHFLVHVSVSDLSHYNVSII